MAALQRLRGQLGQLVEEAAVLLDRVTGQSELTACRREMQQREQQFQEARAALAQAQTAYTRAVLERAKCARDINALRDSDPHLAAKSNLDAFYELTSRRNILATEEELARVARDEQATRERKHFEEFIASLRNSYALEQIIKDKIRTATLGMSALGFVAPFFLFEPFKLRRIEKRMRAVVDQQSQDMERAVLAALQQREGETAAASPADRHPQASDRPESALADGTGADGMMPSTPAPSRSSPSDEPSQLGLGELAQQLGDVSANLHADIAKTAEDQTRVLGMAIAAGTILCMLTVKFYTGY